MAYRPGIAQGDAQADGVGQSRRDLPARADSSRVPRASPAARAHGDAGRREVRALPGGHGAGGRALLRRHRSALREPALVQPVVRRDVGLRLRGPALRDGALLSLRDLEPRWPRPTRSSPTARASCSSRPGPAYGRSPGDPYFDPVWSRLNEAVRTIALHIMPYWYFDAISPGVGPRSDPGVVAHVGVAVEQHLRRAPGRGHALGAHLRQRVRPVSEPARDRVRARRRVGAALRAPHGQEPRHGTQRTVERRPARRAPERDLPPARARRVRIPRTTSRGSSRTSGTTTRSSWAPTSPTPRALPSRPTS